MMQEFNNTVDIIKWRKETRIYVSIDILSPIDILYQDIYLSDILIRIVVKYNLQCQNPMKIIEISDIYKLLKLY